MVDGDGCLFVSSSRGRLPFPNDKCVVERAMTRLVAASLVGRESELRALLQAARTPPAIALVMGEAGVGKTRLVQEVLRQPELEDRTVLVGQCHPLREPFPFGPVIEALARARRWSSRPS